MQRLGLVLLISLLFVNLTFGAAQVGGTIDDFKATWGRPTIEERIYRTARLVWGPYHQQTKLPLGVREAEVQFLDHVACAVLLRGRLGVDETWNWVAKHIGGMIPNCPQSLPKPRQNSSGSREFSLKDGTFIAVRRFKERTIIVIDGPVLLQNEEVFTRESARIHPPKGEQ